MLKSKEELIIQNNALITTNNNEEITGSILNGHLKDFIDSFKIDDGGVNSYILKTFYYSTPLISGTNTSVSIQDTPSYDVLVSVGGLNYYVGVNSNAAFYFKSPLNVIRGKGEITAGDTLHYNSTALKFVLDELDGIILSYIKG